MNGVHRIALLEENVYILYVPDLVSNCTILLILRQIIFQYRSATHEFFKLLTLITKISSRKVSDIFGI